MTAASTLFLAATCVLISAMPPSLVAQVGSSPLFLPAGWRLDPASKAIVHVKTGAQFPEHEAGLNRGEVTTFDDEGENVGIDYRRADGRLWVTVYIYPKEFGTTPDPEMHFRALVEVIPEAYQSSSVKNAVSRAVQLGSTERPGFVALFHYQVESKPVGSLLFLVPVGDRFIKVRASQILERSDDDPDEALQAAITVLESIEVEPSAAHERNQDTRK